MQYARSIRHQPKGSIPLVVGVLIGGKGTRMGFPKALMPHPLGATFVEYAVHLARQITPDVVLLGRLEGLPDSIRDLRVLDDVQPDSGPLAGLCALLKYGSTDWVGLLACDLPFLKPAAFGRLLEHASDEVDAVAFFRDPEEATYHPCCALYHSRVLSIAEGELARGCRLQEVLRRVRLAALRPSKDEERQLKNVNFPSDMLGQPK